MEDDSDSDFEYQEVAVDSDTDSDGEEDLPRAIQALKTATPPDASGRKTKHNDDARAASASDDEGSLTVPGEDACVELFKRFGKNSTGVLTLAEIDTAVAGLYPHFNQKPVLMRAYRTADTKKDGRIGLREFRRLLHYLIFFSDKWEKLQAFDKSHGRRLSSDAFKAGCKTVLNVKSVDFAEREFATLDKNGNGYILFDEFCSWAAIRNAENTMGRGKNRLSESDDDVSRNAVESGEKSQNFRSYMEGKLAVSATEGEQQSIWHDKYIVVGSRRSKADMLREKFELLCFANQQAWIARAGPLFKLRIGEYHVQSADASSFDLHITNKRNSVELRASSELDRNGWMAGLLAMQVAEMPSWSPSQVCRWLEAQRTPDSVLLNLHDKKLPGRFFATAAVSEETRHSASRALREDIGLSESDTDEVLSKLLQFTNRDAFDWLVQKNKDLDGKSAAISFAVSLLSNTKPDVDALNDRDFADGQDGDTEIRQRQHLARRLAMLQEQVSNMESSQRSQVAFRRFSPQKWKEGEDRKRLVVEEKRIRAEMVELENCLHQTSKTKLAKRYPRDKSYDTVAPRYYTKYLETLGERQGDHEGVAGPLPSQDNATDGLGEQGDGKHVAVEWAMTSTGLWASRRHEIDASPPIVPTVLHGGVEKTLSSGSPSPRESKNQDAKSAVPSTAELLATLELALDQNSGTKDHETVLAAVTQRLRRFENVQREAKRHKELNEVLRERMEELEQRTQVLGRECKSYEVMLVELQEVSERALEKSSRSNAQVKEANAGKQDMKLDFKRLQDELQAEQAHSDVLSRKVEYLQRQLREKSVDRQEVTGKSHDIQGYLDQLRDKDVKIEQLKQAVKRQKRNAVVAKEEAVDRGKLLVGAASKLESSQETADKLRQEAVKWQNRVEGAYSAKQTVEAEFRKTKRQLQRATDILLQIWDLLGQKHRFSNEGSFDMADLVPAIEESIGKWSVYRKEAADKDKKINRLLSQVKDMERHLERDQAESFAMLEELQQAKTAAMQELQTDSLLEVIQNLAKMKHDEKLYQDQASYMRSQLTAKEFQVEQERARVDAAVHRERETSITLELELRRTSEEQHGATRDDLTDADRRRHAHAAETTERLQHEQQLVRLNKLRQGSELYKHHSGKVKTDRRYLMLSEDNTTLMYAKDRKNIRKGKRILCTDIRAVNFGFATDNLGSRYFEHITTPEWFCFSLILDARTVDFSANTEMETAMWVVGLRILLEQHMHIYRGLQVGIFFWQRAAMKLRTYSTAANKTRMRYLIDVVKAAGHDWRHSN